MTIIIKAAASLSLVLLAFPWGNFLRAGDSDWPQWRGQHRDGHAAEQSLLPSWPDGGPRLKWQCDTAGIGYSSMAIVDGRVFTMGSDTSDCFALCFDAKSGNRLWKTRIAPAGNDDDYLARWGAGPRCTPTVDGDQVFVLTDVGIVAALDRTSGTVQWSADLVGDFGGQIPKWGYSESPLVDGERVVVTPGEDNFMVALDRRTGHQVWQSRDYSSTSHYVSVMKGTVGQTSFYVTASNKGVVAFDPKTGERWFENNTTGNETATIPTPVLTGDRVYHTSDYGAGNVLLQLREKDDRIEAEQVYHLDGKTMMNHHGGVVLVDGVIYGFTKANGGVWMAQDLESGETLWQEKIRPNGSGSICFGDGRLYCYNDEDGTLYLAKPTRDAWTSTGKLTLPRETSLPRGSGAIWAHPVIADQTLFIRDQDLIFAFDIAG